MTARSPWPERLAVFLTSLVVILVEIALMRELALRFWEHLAWLAISIALLGFGAGGTALVLAHRLCKLSRQTLQGLVLMGLGLSLPVGVRLADSVEVNLIQMVWQPAMMWGVGALEMSLALPFLFAGAFIGLALEDRPERTGGHYAASFLGSGAGGSIAPPLLFVVSPRVLILAGSCLAMLLALIFIRRRPLAPVWLAAALLFGVLLFLMPLQPTISPEKDIAQIKNFPEHEIIAGRYSPRGRIELVRAPAYHLAPGLALNYLEEVPPRHSCSSTAASPAASIRSLRFAISTFWITQPWRCPMPWAASPRC